MDKLIKGMDALDVEQRKQYQLKKVPVLQFKD